MKNNNFIYDPACETRSADEWRVIQTQILRKQLEFCRNHSPYYGKLLKGMDFSAFQTEDLPSLPLTDKADLASDPDSFRAVPMAEIEDIAFSSGTTGRPCKITYSGSDMARLAYNEHRALATAGITKEDIVLLTCTLDRCFIAGLAYYQGVRSIGAAGVRNGLNTIESHAEIFKELNPTVVIGVPSFLRHLGQGLRDRNIDMSCIKRLVCIGEPVRDRNMNITGLCEQVESVWGTRIHSTYASSEIITSFCECEAHNGGHLIPELVVAEIIDDNGNVLPDGSCGELVLTALQTTGMPLIRFRTGDITFKITEPCSCGRQTPRIGPILGRKAQMLKCKGTTLFPQVVFSALDTAEEVLDYYVVVTGEDLSDHLDVYVALKVPGSDLQPIREKLKAVCRMNVPVYEKTADEVRTQVFSRSRKPIRFVDLRKKMKL